MATKKWLMPNFNHFEHSIFKWFTANRPGQMLNWTYMTMRNLRNR